MTQEGEPVAIKKYANRRLYHTGSSEYVTLEDLAVMVREGQDFLVTDAKTGEDITRSVLAQIIFEQESKGGQNLLPATFLRQLIRFYGDSMQALVPRYLAFSLDSLVRNQVSIREQLAQAFGATPFGLIEEQARKNMAIFAEALRAMSPFGAAPEGRESPASAEPAQPREIDELRREMEKLSERIERLSRAGSGSGGQTPG